MKLSRDHCITETVLNTELGDTDIFLDTLLFSVGSVFKTRRGNKRKVL